VVTLRDLAVSYRAEEEENRDVGGVSQDDDVVNRCWGKEGLSMEVSPGRVKF